MNTYEFLLLLAHIGAPAAHIQHAGTTVGKALEAGTITHEDEAATWLDVVDFEAAPGMPIQWVGYAWRLRELSTEWLHQGMPQCADRTYAIGRLYIDLQEDEISELSLVTAEQGKG